MRLTVLLNSATTLYDSEDPKNSAGAVQAVAAYFAGLTDDEQAQFFEEVGRTMQAWPGGMMDQQAHYIGRHLKTCACIGDAGREFLRMVYEASRYEEPIATERCAGAAEQRESIH